MLAGRFRGILPHSPATRPSTALVIGAGVAGTSVAERLAARGWQITVIDEAPGPGHGASGNKAGGSALSALGNETSRALRWLFGVILSVVMLGLGAPFWIQTINGLLRARDLVRGGNQAGDGTRPPATSN